MALCIPGGGWSPNRHKLAADRLSKEVKPHAHPAEVRAHIIIWQIRGPGPKLVGGDPGPPTMGGVQTTTKMK